MSRYGVCFDHLPSYGVYDEVGFSQRHCGKKGDRSDSLPIGGHEDVIVGSVSLITPYMAVWFGDLKPKMGKFSPENEGFPQF